MTINLPITHSKVSTIEDDADTELVRPSDWNDEHVVDTTELDAALAAITADVDALQAAVRTLLIANLDLYVNGSTGSDSNPGTLAAPFATLTGCFNAIIRDYDLQGYTLTVNVAAGTYAGFTVLGPWTGQGTVKLLGASAATVTINSTITLGAIGSMAGAQLQVSEVKLTGSPCVSLIDGATFRVVGNVIYAGTGTHVVLTRRSSYTISNSYHIGAAFNRHIQATQNCTVNHSAGAFTITFDGAYAIGTDFIFLDMASTLVFTIGGITFAGTNPTGKRFTVNNNAVLNSNGQIAQPPNANAYNTYIPGTTVGAISNGLVV